MTTNDAEMRAEFEAAAKENGMYLNRHDDGTYVAPAANAAWWAYRAATRRAGAREAEYINALRSAYSLLANTDGLSKNNVDNLAGEEAEKIAALLAAAPEEKPGGEL